MAKVIDFEVPSDVAEKVYDALEVVRGAGQISKGTNETTKSVERGIAKLVVVAEDVEPAEVVMHIPMICKEKKVPYISVPSKKELGAAVGIEVSTASVAVTDEGKGKKNVDDIVAKIKELQK